MLCILCLFRGMYTFTGNLRVVFVHQKLKSMCIGGAAPYTCGEPAAFLGGGCFLQLPLPFQVQCHHLSTCNDLLSPGCDGGVCSLLVWVDRLLIGMVQQKQSHRGSRSRMLHSNNCQKDPVMIDVRKGRSRSCFLAPSAAAAFLLYP